jgi:CRP-like cAMP-binding protein
MTDFTASAAVPNRLLAGLPPATLAQFRPRLNAAVLPVHRILTRPGEPIDAVYFPESGFVSMVAVLKDGGQAEVGLIGREGMVGAPLAAGVNSCFVTTYPRVAGMALSIEAKAFERELEIHPALRALVLRYNEALHAQSMQSAACNGRHTLPQRLARWLLMAHDRVGGDALPLTQEFLSVMQCVASDNRIITCYCMTSAACPATVILNEPPAECRTLARPPPFRIHDRRRKSPEGDALFDDLQGEHFADFARGRDPMG